ncbi:MAG: hypothetical protein JXA20_10710 [Spirochaetes bacterium]|nr:hypothetical protein [Spirochaetota bacterium]
MKSEIDGIYSEIQSAVNRERLTEISSDIIARYRDRDIDGLSWYASLLDLQFSEQNLNRVFARIIQSYHPDKLTTIQAELERSYRDGDEAALRRLRQAFIFKEAPRGGRRREEPAFEFEEEYRYDDEYEYREEEFTGEEEGVFDDDEGYDEEELAGDGCGGEEFGFIEAIHRYVFGNLDFTMNSHDIMNLEGELNLSDYEIGDLNGIEHCVNVVSINLSGNSIYRVSPIAALGKLESLFLAENNIDNIDPLAHCASLAELDLSYNDIEDVSALLRLKNLRYVNLIGNPLEDRSVIDELAKRGVLVLY